jgi:hypothetical protein
VKVREANGVKTAEDIINLNPRHLPGFVCADASCFRIHCLLRPPDGDHSAYQARDDVGGV